MKANEINTLEGLAEFINNNEDWIYGDVEDIIERNGWTDETYIDYGVCRDGKRAVIFNDNAKAIVINF